MSGAAPSLRGALVRGVAVSLRAWRWLVLGVLVHLLLAAPVAAWAGWRMARATANRPDAPAAGEVPDAALLADFERANPGLAEDLALVVALLVVAAGAARAVLDAGIAAAAADREARVSLAALGAGAGALAWRFLRLLLIAALAAASVRLLLDGFVARHYDEWVEGGFHGDRAAFFALRGREAATLLGLFLLGRVSDAARGALAAGATGSAVRAWLGGFRFLGRHFGRAVAVGLLPAAGQVLLVLGLGTLGNALEGPSLSSVAAAALLFQVLMLLREGCHAAGLAAMTALVAGAGAGRRETA